MPTLNIQDSDKKYYILIVIIIVIVVIAFLYWFFTNMNQNNAPNSESFGSLHANNSKKYKIILYYTNWCGYSKIFLPEWEKLEKYASEQNINNLTIEKLDCDKEGNKCKNINGYPTVIIYDDMGGSKTMDNYPRTLNGIIKFISDYCNK